MEASVAFAGDESVSSGERWLTDKEVADLLGWDIHRVRSARYRNGGPPYVRQGSRVRYPLRAVEAWRAAMPPPDQMTVTQAMEIGDGRLLTINATSKVLGCSIRTLGLWRARGKGPAFTQIGRHVYYRREDLQVWLATGWEPYKTRYGCGDGGSPPSTGEVRQYKIPDPEALRSTVVNAMDDPEDIGRRARVMLFKLLEHAPGGRRRVRFTLDKDWFREAIRGWRAEDRWALYRLAENRFAASRLEVSTGLFSPHETWMLVICATLYEIKLQEWQCGAKAAEQTKDVVDPIDRMKAQEALMAEWGWRVE